MNNKLCTEAALGEDKAITAFKQYAVVSDPAFENLNYVDAQQNCI